MYAYAWMLQLMAALMLMFGGPRDAVTEAEIDGDIDIQVSPATIVMDSAGTWVTIHTDIAYRAVEPDSVRLNGLEPTVVKSDLRGDLVAKFPLQDVLAIVAPPRATLTLSAVTVDGVPVSGSETVPVIDCPQK